MRILTRETIIILHHEQAKEKSGDASRHKEYLQ